MHKLAEHVVKHRQGQRYRLNGLFVQQCRMSLSPCYLFTLCRGSLCNAQPPLTITNASQRAARLAPFWRRCAQSSPSDKSLHAAPRLFEGSLHRSCTISSFGLMASALEPTSKTLSVSSSCTEWESGPDPEAPCRPGPLPGYLENRLDKLAD